MSNTSKTSRSLSPENASKEKCLGELAYIEIDMDGKKEYFLKRIDCDNSAWKPKDNFNCPASIANFKAKKAKKLEQTVNELPSEFESGFDKGLIPEKILGLNEHKGELMCLMAWKGIEEPEMVPAKKANLLCPQIVIEFYEKQLTFIDPPNSKSE